MKITLYCLTILSLFLFTGCQNLDRYERTYAVQVDPDTKSGSVSVTLRPVTPVQPTIPEKDIAAIVAKALAEYQTDKK